MAQDTPPLEVNRMQPAPGRACGSCAMCCKVFEISELAKPAGPWCRNARPGKGCAAYEERPGSCRDFLCEWIVDGRYGPEWKPDTAKFAVTAMTASTNVLIGVDPNFPNAWRREPYMSVIAGWVKAFEAQGRFVIVRIGARCIALLPDKEVELGAVGAGDGVFISREAGPAGYVYSAQVRRRED